jgi:hypothetical protein
LNHRKKQFATLTRFTIKRNKEYHSITPDNKFAKSKTMSVADVGTAESRIAAYNVLNNQANIYILDAQISF